MPKTIASSIYDFPKYYDMIFNADWAQEVKFVDACFQKHSLRKVKRVFEPACGTGRLLVKLAGVTDALPPLPRFDRRRYTDPAELARARE